MSITSVSCPAAAPASSRRRLAALFPLLALLSAAPAQAWVSTATKALPLPASVVTTPVADSQPMRLAISLKLQNRDALESFIANSATPGNPQYGQTLTPAQFAASYAPSAAQAQSVVDYLNAAGLMHVQLAENRLLITAEATAAVAQRAFNTQLARFTVEGRSAFANVADVQMPDALAPLTLAVLGLNDIDRMKTSLASRNAISLPALNFEFNALQFRQAYNVGSVADASNSPIAIVSAGGDLQQVIADLRQYEQVNGLPQVPVTIRQVVPVPSPQDHAGDGEWDLDSQSSTGIAGNVKELLFYNTASLGGADLLAAFNQFVVDNRARIGNMSFGGCESLNYLLGDVAADDQAYMQAVAQGQTFFASAGDAGAACSVVINLGLPLVGVPDVEYPASSPYVVAVGGTTLFARTDGSYYTETVWDGTGGGVSSFEKAPSWQGGVVPLAKIRFRGVPDVAMDADPNTGAAIISNGAATVIGGTSLSSPLAAGAWARLQTAHCNQFGFAAPVLYALDPSGGFLSRASGFNDVRIGTNGLYVAARGWDFTTGFGSFNITAVNAALPLGSCIN